ncbi:MAG TPA: double-strand break repair protein AddB [Stellaceae bacterium]
MRPSLHPARIFTIPADRPFLATVARGLVAEADGDPLKLSRMTVLLPTRRAVRSLREAFLRLTGESTGGAPLLLPRMRPIGDLDADELGFDGSGGDGSEEASLAVPPAIPELRRSLLLTRLVLDWNAREGTGPLLPGQAAALARALARLIDTAATEGADFARLTDLAPAELAEHWQTVLRLLDILPREWPAILAAEGALDPSERRNRLIARQAAQWRAHPPHHPVIAAGLTGGIPALETLISVVANMTQGTVVLAGLDGACTETEWHEIGQDPAHPQYLLAGLLKRLDIDPESVRQWPAEMAPASGRAARLALAANALRPAALTDAWRRLPPASPDALAGMSRHDCASPQDEAVTAALLLRRKLETPGATAALVTPDRELARRVATELRRWGIEIDDSAGVPLNRTPPGAFLRLVLDLAGSGLAPVPLLAALKHPLAAGGIPRERFRDAARRLEDRIRGPRPAPGFAGLRAALTAEDREAAALVDRLAGCLGALPDMLANEAVPIADIAAAHVAAAERLAATDEESGAARLWSEPAGEVAARFCHDLIDAARDFPPLRGRDYPPLFEALVAGAVVRPAYGNHPRLSIWGLVEARLQQADLVVLGGLNEGTWPGIPGYDPWMSRQMRQKFEIALPERAIGIAAHDFASALGAPEVALTRAARREGAPTVPSRWLLRLDAVLRAVGLEGVLGPDPEIGAAARSRDQPREHRPIPLAAPRPPLAARPRRLSVTQIETWLRDPYAIYARHILKLKARDPLDADPDRADLGNAIHKALGDFVGRYPRELPPNAEWKLLCIGEASFGAFLARPAVWGFWWPRFERIARWFIAEEARRRAAFAHSVSECEGSLVVAAPGGPFTIRAIADRIDRHADGGLAIIDYKTGAVPKTADIDAGIAVQLPLEGAIARDGAFPGIAGIPASLEYWKLGGGDPAGEVCPIGDGDPAALIDGVLAAIRDLIARFDDPATPYEPVPNPQWAPRFSDYAQLERLDESEAEP